MAWHTISAEDAIKELRTSPEGLSTSSCADRTKEFGKNVLPIKKRVTLLKIILHQFLSPLIYVLLGAAVVSFLLGEYSDAAFIFLILFINAVIGASQECKAEAKASAPQEMIRIKVKVKRDGKIHTLDSEDLVPGDIVLLESGNKVPADIRIVNQNNLTVEEAILTGESMAIQKRTEAIEKEDLPISDKTNMLFGGTTITTGRATGVVVSTGVHTEIGKIASSLKDLQMGKAPLVERMEVFAKKISLFVLIGCVFLGVIGYFNGIGPKDIFFFVVAVAVSAIPEGLPIAMTVALSIGASRMAKRNVIIRKLTAVEGLGSCTLIATDKTGTLTVDQQTAKAIVLPDAVFTISGEGYNGEGKIVDEAGNECSLQSSAGLENLIRSIGICNEATLKKEDGRWVYTGDPVDIAMLSLAFKAGTSPDAIANNIERVKEIPFESERQFAEVYYKEQGVLRVAIKGAIEKVAGRSKMNLLLEKANTYARNGYRIIAVAGGEVPAVIPTDEIPEVELLGFVALIDPLRPEANPAIHACHKAGVDVAMITGDHPSTAFAIAKEVGIATDQSELINGIELENLWRSGPEQFKQALQTKRVFSRVSPHQKQQIVETLRDGGHFIAVTGDGVNDAPALKTANIGIAMGYGTDVAKDTASIIVTDNNFASIVAGIEEGRFTYSNLRKIIYLLISTGAAELLMIAMSLIFQLPLPFLPLQLLWLNLVTNGMQDVALAFEAGEPKVMKDPPRKPEENVFDPLMIKQTLVSASVIALLSFGLWYHLLNHLHWDESTARNTILLLMVLLQNFHVFNCRSETESFLKVPIKNNLVLMAGIVGAQTVHVVSMHIPFMQDLLSLSPVSIEDWVKLFFTASIIIVVMEIFKVIYARRRRNSI